MILKIKTTTKNIAIIAIIILLAFFYYLFQTTGIRLFFGIILIYFLPAYLILGKFELETIEKFFFSFFISLGIFPLLTYYFGKLSSFRMGALLSFILLMAIALFLRKKDFAKLSKKLKNIEISE